MSCCDDVSQNQARTMGRAEGNCPQTAHRWRRLEITSGSRRWAWPRMPVNAEETQDEIGTVMRTNWTKSDMAALQ